MTHRALLIGNSVFKADTSLNSLNAPTKDVTRMQHALTDPATGLFDDGEVLPLINADCEDILDRIEEFYQSSRLDDLLLLYYSGHGLLDEDNQLYLCSRDTRSDRLLRTAVSNVRINEFAKLSNSRHKVFVLDCCSSGMFMSGPVGAQLAGRGRYVVSSTRGPALANDAIKATGTSLFTEYFVRGLLGSAGDLNHDGYLDLREIYDFTRNQMRVLNHSPQCRFDGDGDIPLARSGGPAPVHRTLQLPRQSPAAAEESELRDGQPAPSDPAGTASEHPHPARGRRRPSLRISLSIVLTVAVAAIVTTTLLPRLVDNPTATGPPPTLRSSVPVSRPTQTGLLPARLIVQNVYDLPSARGLADLTVQGFSNVTTIMVCSNSVSAGRIRQVLLGSPDRPGQELVGENGSANLTVATSTPLLVKVSDGQAC